jgi:hypothetical protein
MGETFDPIQVTVARQLYVAKDEADKEAALARQAEYTQGTIAVSRPPDGEAGSHVPTWRSLGQGAVWEHRADTMATA